MQIFMFGGNLQKYFYHYKFITLTLLLPLFIKTLFVHKKIVNNRGCNSHVLKRIKRLLKSMSVYEMESKLYFQNKLTCTWNLLWVFFVNIAFPFVEIHPRTFHVILIINRHSIIWRKKLNKIFIFFVGPNFTISVWVKN